MASQTLRTIEEKMQKTAEGLKKELATLRTGHATPTLLEHIRVDYAGTPMPLNQISAISAPEARLLIIQPWDKGTIKNIVQAIQTSDLGLNPQSDGNVIRVAIPPLSEERRQEMIKIVHKRVEERKVAIRNLRRDATEELRQAEKNKEISQDEQKKALAQLQKLTDSFIGTADQIGRDKETELKQV